LEEDGASKEIIFSFADSLSRHTLIAGIFELFSIPKKTSQDIIESTEGQVRGALPDEDSLKAVVVIVVVVVPLLLLVAAVLVVGVIAMGMVTVGMVVLVVVPLALAAKGVTTVVVVVVVVVTSPDFFSTVGHA